MGAEAGSTLQRLRAERERALGPKTLTLGVPGWSNLLYVRYKPVDWPTISAILEEAGTADPAAALNLNIDALIEGCDALLVNVDEELKPLADELRGQGEDVHGEVRFDEYAVDALQLGPDVVTARETVLAVFAGAVSPELSITEHAARLGAWMAGATQEADKALLGE